MPYARRDAAGKIVAASLEPTEGFEEIDSESPDLLEFETQLQSQRSRLLESDIEVVRVLDDLINVLVAKNLILFTELPPEAQKKLLTRRGLRESAATLGLISEEGPLL